MFSFFQSSFRRRAIYRRCWSRSPQRERAFTLLELLIVVALLAVLAGMLFGANRRVLESGRRSRAQVELSVLAAALERYRLSFGDYPRTDDPARLLQSLIGKRGPDQSRMDAVCLIDLASFRMMSALDPFATDAALLADPWDRPYRYAYKPDLSWTNPGYVLSSTGPDGVAAPLRTGGFPDPVGSEQEDNLYAQP